MLNIEVIKFEAQDVITASVAVPEDVVMENCSNPNGHSGQVVIENGVMNFKCKYCGADVSASGSIQGGN